MLLNIEYIPYGIFDKLELINFIFGLSVAVSLFYYFSLVYVVVMRVDWLDTWTNANTPK